MTPERAVEWMTEHGTPNYANRINELEVLIEETKADAGRYWSDCEFTVAKIVAILAEIDEVREHALERYTDWATD